MSNTEPYPWCEISWAEVHAACRAGGYDPGTPAQRRAFLDGLPPGVTVEDDDETCWKMAGRWFSEFGQVTEREVEDWCADDACWPVEVIADDLRAWAMAAMRRAQCLTFGWDEAQARLDTAHAWALAALERCRVLEAQRDSERRHADELVQRIRDVTEALGDRRQPGRPLVEDVRAVAQQCAGYQAALMQPLPVGQVLKPEHFGKDEGGVLRLAALLAEAPEGAVVRCSEGEESEKGADGVWASDGYWSDAAFDLAERAPLTVVAWPGGAS